MRFITALSARLTCPKPNARPIRHNAQVPDRNGKIFYTSITSLSHISKQFGDIVSRADCVICADDTAEHKPEPGPLLKYMERTGAKPSEVLYVGDTVYDMQCARGAGVDFALARWGNPDGRVDADYDEPTPMALLEKLR